MKLRKLKKGKGKASKDVRPWTGGVPVMDVSGQGASPRAREIAEALDALNSRGGPAIDDRVSTAGEPAGTTAAAEIAVAEADEAAEAVGAADAADGDAADAADGDAADDAVGADVAEAAERSALAETMYRAAQARLEAAEARERAADERLRVAEAAEEAAAQRLAAADAGERAAAERLAAAEARERAALERIAATGAREEATAGRLAAAEARERAAAERDAIANQRDRAAAERDAIANERDRALNEREQAQPDRGQRPATREQAERGRSSAEHELEIARLEAELERAHLDSLTGALRREIGRLTLHNEIERARRTDGRFVLAFVDVDDLKGINDREGHAAGDRVLRTLAATLRANLRTYDPVVRYGGDEFVCGVTGVGADELEHRMTLIDQSLRRATGVGISAGMATLREGETLDEITVRADEALLEAKRNRDR